MRAALLLAWLPALAVGITTQELHLRGGQQILLQGDNTVNSDDACLSLNNAVKDYTACCANGEDKKPGHGPICAEAGPLAAAKIDGSQAPKPSPPPLPPCPGGDCRDEASRAKITPKKKAVLKAKATNIKKKVEELEAELNELSKPRPSLAEQKKRMMETMYGGLSEGCKNFFLAERGGHAPADGKCGDGHRVCTSTSPSGTKVQRCVSARCSQDDMDKFSANINSKVTKSTKPAPAIVCESTKPKPVDPCLQVEFATKSYGVCCAGEGAKVEGHAPACEKAAAAKAEAAKAEAAAAKAEAAAAKAEEAAKAKAAAQEAERRRREALAVAVPAEAVEVFPPMENRTIPGWPNLGNMVENGKLVHQEWSVGLAQMMAEQPEFKAMMDTDRMHAIMTSTSQADTFLKAMGDEATRSLLVKITKEIAANRRMGITSSAMYVVNAILKDAELRELVATLGRTILMNGMFLESLKEPANAAKLVQIAERLGPIVDARSKLDPYMAPATLAVLVPIDRLFLPEFGSDTLRPLVLKFYAAMDVLIVSGIQDKRRLIFLGQRMSQYSAQVKEVIGEPKIKEGLQARFLALTDKIVQALQDSETKDKVIMRLAAINMLQMVGLAPPPGLAESPPPAPPAPPRPALPHGPLWKTPQHDFPHPHPHPHPAAPNKPVSHVGELTPGGGHIRARRPRMDMNGPACFATHSDRFYENRHRTREDWVRNPTCHCPGREGKNNCKIQVTYDRPSTKFPDSIEEDSYFFCTTFRDLPDLADRIFMTKVPEEEMSLTAMDGCDPGPCGKLFRNMSTDEMCLCHKSHNMGRCKFKVTLKDNKPAHYGCINEAAARGMLLTKMANPAIFEGIKDLDFVRGSCAMPTSCGKGSLDAYCTCAVDECKIKNVIKHTGQKKKIVTGYSCVRPYDALQMSIMKRKEMLHPATDFSMVGVCKLPKEGGPCRSMTLQNLGERMHGIPTVDDTCTCGTEPNMCKMKASVGHRLSVVHEKGVIMRLPHFMCVAPKKMPKIMHGIQDFANEKPDRFEPDPMYSELRGCEVPDEDDKKPLKPDKLPRAKKKSEKERSREDRKAWAAVKKDVMATKKKKKAETDDAEPAPAKVEGAAEATEEAEKKADAEEKDVKKGEAEDKKAEAEDKKAEAEAPKPEPNTDGNKADDEKPKDKPEPKTEKEEIDDGKEKEVAKEAKDAAETVAAAAETSKKVKKSTEAGKKEPAAAGGSAGSGPKRLTGEDIAGIAEQQDAPAESKKVSRAAETADNGESPSAR